MKNGNKLQKNSNKKMQLLKYRCACDGEYPQAIKTKDRNIWNAGMADLQPPIYFWPF